MKTATRPIDSKSEKSQEATALLRADHKVVEALFKEFETAKTSGKKKQIVAKICAELTVHTQIEEEIFYPTFKKVLKDKELVPEAIVEHTTVKDLIAQVENVEPDGEMYDAKVMVLIEYVKHHVKEEEDEMFPKAESSDLDLSKLGASMAERKTELMAKRG